MKNMRITSEENGQSSVEYAIIVAAATAALIIMGTYVRRAVQANLKQTEIAINGSVAESNDGGGGGSGGTVFTSDPAPTPVPGTGFPDPSF